LFQRAYTARKITNTAYFSLYVLPRTERRPVAAKTILASPFSSDEKSKLGEQELLETTKTSLATRPTSQEIARMHSSALPLVGFVVAKKVCKCACLRNKVKRRIREAYRLLRLSDPQARQDLAQWYAMVFVIQPKAIDADWSQLQGSVSEALSRATAKYGTKKSQGGSKQTGAIQEEGREKR
jgi:ribonuclease P protein component